jgi:hypothetical protein
MSVFTMCVPLPNVVAGPLGAAVVVVVAAAAAVVVAPAAAVVVVLELDELGDEEQAAATAATPIKRLAIARGRRFSITDLRFVRLG